MAPVYGTIERPRRLRLRSCRQLGDYFTSEIRVSCVFTVVMLPGVATPVVHWSRYELHLLQDR